ncbi:MAG: hypothetical protein J5911_02440 [Clostridia bacterium]|nr:hypothetical protein [Clostridia bacterium]
MKIFVLMLIPLFTALIGFVSSMKYSDARDFWERFEFWHKKIKSEITFSQRSLLEIFNGSEDLYKNDKFLSVAKDYLQKGKTDENLNFLSKNEKEFIYKYFQNLGTMDRDSQLNYLNSLETELNKYVSDAGQKDKKYRPLFVKMGFLLGLVVFIMII